MLNPAFRDLDLEELTVFYKAESDALREALLNGTDWSTVKQQQLLVKQLDIAINQRKLSGTDPSQGLIDRLPWTGPPA
ncbi:MAG: hypothetical protein JWP69_960 [Flaviaesturariibacter sp.]|nr:hypothetical protein [Flaviaesturariibacter sp.]